MVILLFALLLGVYANEENLAQLCAGEDVFCDPDSKGVTISKGRRGSGVSWSFGYAPDRTDIKEERACEFRERVFVKAPKAVKTGNGGWKYLVSDQHLFNQPITIERCLNQGRPCSALIGLLTAGVETTCSQKYITVHVETVEPKTQIKSGEKVQIPVACVCSIRSYYFPGR